MNILNIFLIILIILLIIINLSIIIHKETFINNVIDDNLVKKKLNIISNSDIENIFDEKSETIIIYENSGKCNYL